MLRRARVGRVCDNKSCSLTFVKLCRALSKTPQVLRSSQCRTRATNSHRLRQEPSASALSKIGNIPSQQIVYNAHKRIGPVHLVHAIKDTFFILQFVVRYSKMVPVLILYVC